MPARKIDNRRDIMLLLLYSPGIGDSVNEPIVGRTRLMKMLFLFKEEAMRHFRRGTEINEENFYEFFPWNFGPFSSQVYDDLNFFTLRGFIQGSDSTEEPLPESAAEWAMWLTYSDPEMDIDGILEYDEQQFSLAKRGVQFTEELYSLLSGNQRKFLQEFKKRLLKAPLRAILKYVYRSYPDQTKKSQIREKVLG